MKLFSKVIAAVMLIGAAALTVGQANAAPVITFNIANGGSLTGSAAAGLTMNATIDSVEYTDTSGVIHTASANATLVMSTGAMTSSSGSVYSFAGGSYSITGFFNGVDLGVTPLSTGSISTTTLTSFGPIGFLSALLFDSIIADDIKNEFIPGFIPGGSPIPHDGVLISPTNGTLDITNVDLDINDGGVVHDVPAPLGAGLLGLGLIGMAAMRRRKAA